MRVLWALAAKDLRLLRRDRLGLFFSLGFPLLMALFFGFISGGGGGPRRLAVALVDEDGSAASAAYAARLAESGALAVERLPLAEARERVRRGGLVAYVRMQPGFGERQGFFPDLGSLEVGIDPARQAERGVLQGLLIEKAFQGLRQAMADRGEMDRALRREQERLQAGAEEMPPEIAGALRGFFGELERFNAGRPPGEGAPPAGALGNLDIRFLEVTLQGARPRTAFEVTFPAGILWGVLGTAAGFAVSLVVERTSGTLTRLRLAPIGLARVLAGKGLACAIAILVVIFLLLALAALLFRVRLPSLPLLGAAAAATAACFTGIMMLVSVLGRTPRAVGGGAWALFLPMSMLGGGTIPLIAMPDWMQRLASVSPVKWGILALEGAIWRGFTPAEMALPCAVLVGLGALAFALGVIRARLL